MNLEKSQTFLEPNMSVVKRESVVNDDTSREVIQVVVFTFQPDPSIVKQENDNRKTLEIELIDPEQKTYICDYCQKLFISKSNITRHMICVHASGSHKLIKSYKCDECEKSFICKGYLRIHKVRMHPALLKKCNVCGKLIRLRGLRTHMQNMHSDTKHRCNICGEIMVSKTRLYSHMNKVHPNEPIDADNSTYYCDYCQKAFSNKSTLARHIVCVHANGSYKCDKCEKSYICEDYLRAHKVNMHSALMKKCNICGKSLRPRSLKRHMRNTHSNTKHPCSTCGKILMSKESLSYHMSTIHGNQPIEDNRCHYCMKVYSTKQTLKYHMARMHGNRDYNCSECTISFKSEHRLRRHLNLVHSKEECEEALNRCHYCKKIYSTKQTLKFHIERLHGNRDYKCSECTMSFKSEPRLQKHLKLVHSKAEREETLNKCHYCDKIYTTKQTLKFHMTSVHGNGDHKCSECTESFKSEPCLRKHLKLVHSKACEESNQHSECNVSEKENGKSTHGTADKLNIVDDTNSKQHKVVDIKKEPVDEILEVGAVVFQHMDSNYRPLKEEPAD